MAGTVKDHWATSEIVLCIQTQRPLIDFYQSFCRSSQTWAIKTRQLKASPALSSEDCRLRLQKAQPFSYQDWDVSLAGDEKFECGRRNWPIGWKCRWSVSPPLTHLSFCTLRSSLRAVPMVCANLSMFCGVWGRGFADNNTDVATDADMPSLPGVKAHNS